MAACPGSASTLWTSAAAHALFGLNIDDPDSSFYTCMKELFDNAVDACSGSGRIESGEIHLRVEARTEALLDVTIKDNGCGFSDLHSCTSELFMSSKNSDMITASKQANAKQMNELGGATAGVFGVGIKAVILWAHLSAPLQAVEIVTTKEDSHEVDVLRMKFDGEKRVGSFHRRPVFDITSYA